MAMTMQAPLFATGLHPSSEVLPSADENRIDEPLESGITPVALPTSYAEFGERKLSRLCDGLGLSQQRRSAIELFRFLTKDWSHWPLGEWPAWRSDITDDGTPFEFSVAFGVHVPRLRILVESQQSPIGRLSTWLAALRLNERLKSVPGVDLERFERIRDLFTPGERSCQFHLWHAADLNQDGSAAFKLYLNPQVSGPQRARGIVDEALSRLDLEEASTFLSSPARGGGAHNSFAYCSLDLSSTNKARVKVYVAHGHATGDEIDAALEGCIDHVRGDGTRWMSGMLGSRGPFDRRPILTCYAFTGDRAPPRATLHIPVRSYLRSDAEAVERASEFLGSQGSALRSALSQTCSRALDQGRGCLTYVSFKRIGRDTSVSTYIAPEAYTVEPRA
jgi:DMATS type aromatic prenyltransferase